MSHIVIPFSFPFPLPFPFPFSFCFTFPISCVIDGYHTVRLLLDGLSFSNDRWKSLIARLIDLMSYYRINQ